MVGSLQTRTTGLKPAVRVSLLDRHAAAAVHGSEINLMKTAFRTLPERNRDMLALLIAAHNEELVLENTIRSAIRAGMDPQHIYVVDDNSTDPTSEIARSILPAQNVIKVRRSGKGLALTKANKHFKLTRRYRWIHIADADGAFDKEYFAIFRKNLDPSYSAATGYVRSLPGGPISMYRVFEYTMGMEVTRRIQSTLGIIPIIPGPTSCFRADIFAKVNFANKSLTEDFDVTLQMHRQGMGQIQFIPEAVAYTQDPRTLSDFIKQITRWNRGVMQGVTRHKIGTKFRKVDAYLSFQIWQNLMFAITYLFWIPFLAYTMDRVDLIAVAFLMDVALTLGMAIISTSRSRRGDILAAFPFLYGLRWIALAVFLKAFVEVGLLKKHRVTEGAWSTAGRRYKITTAQTA